MPANPPTARLTTLRQMSRAMLEGYEAAALRRQPHPELSPLLWHVGHVFFVENYWIAERIFGDTEITQAWRRVYFPENCAKTVRGDRLPDADAVRTWTIEVARCNDHYWARADNLKHPLLDNGYLLAFVCQHYAQHLETMRLAGAQLDLGDSALMPVDFAPRREPTARATVPGQRVRLGTSSIEAYDNEQPPVERSVQAFDIAAAPVDNAQYLAFIEDDGYARAELWDEAGWRWRCQYAVTHPQHWRATGNGWSIPGLNGGSAAAQEPVHGIGWYEARAFARYAGARLPAESEWETAARAGLLPAAGRVWEWCDDAFAPYPGFIAFPYEGYSQPWFDDRHFVARGASVHAEPEIVRPGFRNFYPPTHRHVFAGLRLAD